MPSMASMILGASRVAARAACLAASAASRIARSGSGGAAASDPLMRGPAAGAWKRLSLRSGRSPVAASPSGPGSRSGSSPSYAYGRGPTIVKVTPPPFDMEKLEAFFVKGRKEFEADEKDLESDEALWALYERWCKAFNQERDHDEMARRFSRFKESVLRVQQNKKAGLPYTLEINKFADGKLLELSRPSVPIGDYVRRMPYSDSVIYGRTPDFVLKDEPSDTTTEISNQSA